MKILENRNHDRRDRDLRYYTRLKADPEKWKRYLAAIAARAPRYKSKKRISRRLWQRRQRENNPEFRIKNSLRSRLSKCLKRAVAPKADAMNKLLGCRPSYLKTWIESKWQPGMTWDNYGTDWQIDHRFPLSVFDLSNPDDQCSACHYTNLQPLWTRENLSKGSKILV